MNEPYSVLIIPSSDEERKAAEMDFGSAWLHHQAGLFESSSIYSFATQKERTAFIKGYRAAIGYNGNGVFFTHNKNEQQLKLQS